MIGSLVFLSTVVSAVSATKSLSISVNAPQSNLDVNDLQVTTTLVNTGDETLKLLNEPATLLSTWATNSFAISNSEGASPDFTGVVVRYAPEVAAKSDDPSTFTVLEPGASVDIAHDVGLYYNFTSVGAGEFTFTPSNLFTAIETDGTLTTVEAEVASSATARLTGRLAATRRLSPNHLGGSPDARHGSSSLQKRASYRSNCSSSRQSTNNAAISAGATLATRAASHLTSNPSGSSLQTTWYGTFSSSRYSVTLTAFNRLKTYPAGWTYDCSCTESGTYAYVYPSEYGVVYLCGYYWNAPATGSGSRADTIIHEGTHFTQVLGTDDYTYGESSCKSLAKSNPTNAVYNADNHAFFSDYA